MSSIATLIIVLVVEVVTVVSEWRVFKKCNKPGWAAIIPFYNQWIIFELADMPGWWSLALVPYIFTFINDIDKSYQFNPLLLTVIIVSVLVGLVLSIKASIKIAERFNHSAIFGFLAISLFPFVGWTILANELKDVDNLKKNKKTKLKK